MADFFGFRRKKTNTCRSLVQYSTVQYNTMYMYNVCTYIHITHKYIVYMNGMCRIENVYIPIGTVLGQFGQSWQTNQE